MDVQPKLKKENFLNDQVLFYFTKLKNFNGYCLLSWSRRTDTFILKKLKTSTSQRNF